MKNELMFDVATRIIALSLLRKNSHSARKWRAWKNYIFRWKNLYSSEICK